MATQGCKYLESIIPVKADYEEDMKMHFGKGQQL